MQVLASVEILTWNFSSYPLGMSTGLAIYNPKTLTDL